MSMLTLVKYQGLGNDFLVALDGQEVDAGAEEMSRHSHDTEPPGQIAS